MIAAIPVPADNADVRSLPKIVARLAKFANAWLNNSIVVGSADGSTGVDISEANVTIKLPAGTGGGGSGSAGNQWWVVAIDGQPMVCQFASGTPVATLPAGATLVNPS